MREERVEVALTAQMQDLLVVRVVDMREYPEELAVHVLDGGREVRRKFLTYRRRRMVRCLHTSRQTETRTRLCREHVLVVKQVLHPSHHVVDVSRCGQLHALPILVDPRVVETVE